MVVNDEIRSYTRREQRRLIEVIKFSIQYYWRVSKIESWPGWFVETEKFLTIRIFPPWIPNLSLTFRLQFRISSLELEKYFLFRICKKRKLRDTVLDFITENIPNKWRNEMETSKIERIVFWLILHTFFNNFFYHLLVLVLVWIINYRSIIFTIAEWFL